MDSFLNEAPLAPQPQVHVPELTQSHSIRVYQDDSLEVITELTVGDKTHTMNTGVGSFEEAQAIIHHTRGIISLLSSFNLAQILVSDSDFNEEELQAEDKKILDRDRLRMESINRGYSYVQNFLFTQDATVAKQFWEVINRDHARVIDRAWRDDSVPMALFGYPYQPSYPEGWVQSVKDLYALRPAKG